jgi:hypothetical protein
MTRILYGVTAFGLACFTACSSSSSNGASTSNGGSAGASSSTAGSAASSSGGSNDTTIGGSGETTNGAGTSASLGGNGDSAGASSDDAGAAGEMAVNCAEFLGDGAPASEWVFAKPDGTLGYKSIDAEGDRILDFSYAGYMGGGVALPKAAVVATLAPSGADDTAAIQAALDAASKRALVGGLRGAVTLKAGTFKVLGTLHIAESGVVLRGAGSGKGGTEIDLSGTPHEFLVAAGTGTWLTSAAMHVTDSYVPSGSNSLSVDDASGFKVGDTVLVDRPVTAAWVHFMGMDTLVRDGAPQTWLAVGTLIHADRTIRAIDGKKLTFDAPLSDSYDAKYVSPPGATVSKYTFAGRISQVGVEGLSVVAPATATAITEPQYQALDMDAVEDAWVTDFAMHETVNSIALGAASKRITLQGIILTRTLPADGSAGYPLEITVAGTQILVQHANMQGDNIYTYATGPRVSGPNVFFDAVGTGVHNRAEPHQRWATGLLADQVTGEQINFYNRGTAGSGHGWAVGFGVVWNGEATSLDIEQPPGSQNFALGCKGKEASSTVAGVFESLGTHLAPKSLYLAQLCARLGSKAVSAIGD